MNDGAQVCLSCGAVNEDLQLNKYKITNKFGVAGFVVGLLSVWTGLFSGIVAIIGVVLSTVGLVKMRKCTSCNVLAYLGYILSLFTLFFWGFLIAGASYLYKFGG